MSTLSRTSSLADSDGQSFVCNRCQKAMILDSSLQDIDGSALPNLQLAPEVSSHSAVLATLLELASDTSQVDHPLCVECFQLLSFELHKQLAELDAENERYTLYYSQLEKCEKNTDKKEETIDTSIENLLFKQAELQATLDTMKDERVALEESIFENVKEQKKVTLLEERYWESSCDFESQLFECKEEESAVMEERRKIFTHLENLRSTNVCNDTFHISSDGHFGTINGLRIGSLPSQPVEWNEINAAWGQASLLLSVLARKMKYKFKTFRIIPLGSSSKMERYQDKSIFELFGSREITLGKLLWFRRFDTAMVGFITCLEELMEHVCDLDPSVKFPFKIVKDKIAGWSIKKQFNSEEEWTRAAKLVLINMKFLLAEVTRIARNSSLETPPTTPTRSASSRRTESTEDRSLIINQG